MSTNQITKNHSGKIVTVLILLLAMASWSWALEDSPDMRRFFFTGDGQISLYSEKTNKSFCGVYRKGLGGYDEKALYQICQVFDAPCESSPIGISLRLIEFIDYLEDRLNSGAKITVISGYRNPEYNTMLREKGNLAAKASLHQYGMAADLKIQGVEAKALWNYVNDFKFGGVGYYHGDMVHIDVGPARSWDETTSGVGTGISDNNKLIGIITEYDIYQPGMTVNLRFIRMTAFPIHVSSRFSIIRQKDQDDVENRQNFTPVFNIPQTNDCMVFRNIDEMNHIKWELPKDLNSGRYRIQTCFCDDAWPDMPRQIQTPEFECIKVKTVK
jgi:uncharacterized protein YcbK (DUF882 family)